MRLKVASRVGAVIALVMLWAPVAQAGSGPGGTPQGLPAGTGPMLCRVITGETVGGDYTVEDQYGSRTVRLGSGRILCTSIVALQNIPPSDLPDAVADANALRCFSLTTVAGKGQAATPAPDPDSITDGLAVNEPISVSNPEYLCLPAHVNGP